MVVICSAYAIKRSEFLIYSPSAGSVIKTVNHVLLRQSRSKHLHNVRKYLKDFFSTFHALHGAIHGSAMWCIEVWSRFYSTFFPVFLLGKRWEFSIAFTTFVRFVLFKSWSFAHRNTTYNRFQMKIYVTLFNSLLFATYI